MLVTSKLSGVVACEFSGLWLSPERSDYETNRIVAGAQKGAL